MGTEEETTTLFQSVSPLPSPLNSRSSASSSLSATEIDLQNHQHRDKGDDGDPGPCFLVVGNYCHDVLFRDGVVVGEGLGGAASFVSNVFNSLFASSSHLFHSSYVSKVGTDFAYTLPGSHPPLVSPTAATTLFHAHFPSLTSADLADRVLKRVHSCDPILPSDLPSSKFRFGLAVGVGGEIPPLTLARLVDLCALVFVDAQSLIRTFDPSDGTVGLIPLKDSEFSSLVSQIGFLKVSAEEAPFLDIDEARKWCCVILTQGKDGCSLFWKDGHSQVLPFPTVQIDPTGAGDSFLGAFVAGLAMGLGVQESALLGNFFGSLTVGQIGIPKFDQKMMQKIKQEVERNATSNDRLCGRHDAPKFQKSLMHEELRAFLFEVAKLQNTDGATY
ncbi:Inositol 3-kinase protein [Dioscorea alata]|uniref:Inositol 3-kinase protein n=1 Tax=Dioscorea alata TaxID=55571 RepID=A0ACB7VGU4_DIOAL|nr:Inositol 3-kinase protein [Dioscorea alata]